MPGNEVFPILQPCTRLPFDEDGADPTVFDVKFYPYATDNNDQLFAIVAANVAAILRPKLGCDPPFEILRWFRDEQKPQASYNSLCWTRHPRTKKPLLCIAGFKPKHIKVFDVESGQVIRTLPGHGKEINDLAISPLSTSLVASASSDSTIRLWNLEDEYHNQPCVAIFAGEGHKSNVLAIDFHDNGAWLLSGGIDTAVCLWAVPSLAALDKGDDDSHYRDPKTVFYPHFFSKEVHPNYVDCIAFYGDLIISKAAREPETDKNEILIWKIDGFDSDHAVPSELPTPVAGKRTRSSFPHDKRFSGFQRLITLDMPNTSRFYHRFGLLHEPGMRPILAMGNEVSAYLFWDLQRLDEGIDPRERPRSRKTQRPKSNVAKFESALLNGIIQPRGSSRDGTPSSNTDISSAAGSAEREFALRDPFMKQAPHHKKIIDTKLTRNHHFATSQIAFSPDGTWMVGVGDHGMICLFHRDKSVVGSAPTGEGGAS